jgi:hypothetical protein
MINENLERPQSLWQMIEVANSTPIENMGWYYDKSQGWVIPYFDCGDGRPILLSKKSVRNLIKALQEFCQIATEEDITEYNNAQAEALAEEVHPEHAQDRLIDAVLKFGVTPGKPGYVYIVQSQE